MYDTGDYAISDLAELFSISRPTVYRTRPAGHGHYHQAGSGLTMHLI
jgi:predicted DNA-binding protein YlxM (UPF0122 family)